MSQQVETVTISLSRYKELEEIEQLAIKKSAKGNVSGWNGYTYFSFGEESTIPEWFQKQAKENERMCEENAKRLNECTLQKIELEKKLMLLSDRSLLERVVNKL